MINLDLKCAEAAEAIAEIEDDGAETLITKALGVLQEDGIYAFFLYLNAKKEKLCAAVSTQAVKLLKGADIVKNNDDGLKVAKAISGDLDKILLAKELLERMLVYARYHAKAQ